MTFNKEARELYLSFAMEPEAAWRANFRDLSASVTRMATLAPQGRINEETVRDADDLDLFDRAQLVAVLKVCRESNSLSAAGRELFAQSRKLKTSGNDADRLRKYLMRFGLSFEAVASGR